MEVVLRTHIFLTKILMAVLFSGLILSPKSLAQCLVITKNNDRFEIVKSGQAIKDHETGIMWMRCPTGQQWKQGKCSGRTEHMMFSKATGKPKFWHGADAKLLSTFDGKPVAKKSALGSKDWRLPKFSELKTIINKRCDANEQNSAFYTPLVKKFNGDPPTTTMLTASRLRSDRQIKYRRSMHEDFFYFDILTGELGHDSMTGIVRLVRRFK